MLSIVSQKDFKNSSLYLEIQRYVFSVMECNSCGMSQLNLRNEFLLCSFFKSLLILQPQIPSCWRFHFLILEIFIILIPNPNRDPDISYKFYDLNSNGFLPLKNEKILLNTLIFINNSRNCDYNCDYFEYDFANI